MSGWKTRGRVLVVITGWSVGMLFLIGLLSPVPCLLSEAAELKMGYVNIAKVFDSYQRTKDSGQVLEQKGKQKQAELEGRFGELKKLRENLELLNDQARDAKSKELEEKSDEFQRLKTKSEREIVHDRNQIAKEIMGEIEQVIKEYAKAKGFSLILDQRSLVYGQEAYDVTGEVLQFLNDRYASKAGKGKS